MGHVTCPLRPANPVQRKNAIAIYTPKLENDLTLGLLRQETYRSAKDGGGFPKGILGFVHRLHLSRSRLLIGEWYPSRPDSTMS